MATDLPAAASAGPARPHHRRLLVGVLGTLVLLASLLVPQAASARTAKRPMHTKAEVAAILAVARVLEQERQANGLPTVHYNARLVVSARRHDLKMAAFDEMSHQLPGEAYFANRISSAGYRWSWAGENIGWNSNMSTAGVVQLEKLMYAEKPPNDGHRQNILSRHFHDIGIDVYYDYAHHKVWLTVDFGHH